MSFNASDDLSTISRSFSFSDIGQRLPNKAYIEIDIDVNSHDPNNSYYSDIIKIE